MTAVVLACCLTAVAVAALCGSWRMWGRAPLGNVIAVAAVGILFLGDAVAEWVAVILR